MKGKAKITIDGFPLTDKNYKEALYLLKARFGDNKLLQASFIDSLIKLKGVSDSRDNKTLRTLHVKIETYVWYHADSLHYAKITSNICLEITKNLVDNT